MSSPARALVVGASGGIGGAVAAALAGRGAAVTGLSRSAGDLDVTREATVETALGALGGPFDLVFVAIGALVIHGHEPEKSISRLDPEAMRLQFELNTIGPAMVVKHAVPLLPKEGRAVIAVLSARVGSIEDNGLGGWMSYRTAKAGVNQIVRCAAVELRRTHPDAIAVALHPGTVETPFTKKYASRYPTVPPAEAAANLLAVLDGLTPADSGGFFDWRGDRLPF